jgi:uncharacterized protein YpmS
MAEQCTEAKLADQFQASAIGFSRSNGVVGNMPTVLSRGDVCLNLCDLDTGIKPRAQVMELVQVMHKLCKCVQMLNMAEWLNVLNILTSNLTELAEHV